MLTEATELRVKRWFVHAVEPLRVFLEFAAATPGCRFNWLHAHGSNFTPPDVDCE